MEQVSVKRRCRYRRDERVGVGIVESDGERFDVTQHSKRREGKKGLSDQVRGPSRPK